MFLLVAQQIEWRPDVWLHSAVYVHDLQRELQHVLRLLISERGLRLVVVYPELNQIVDRHFVLCLGPVLQKVGRELLDLGHQHRPAHELRFHRTALAGRQEEVEVDLQRLAQVAQLLLDHVVGGYRTDLIALVGWERVWRGSRQLPLLLEQQLLGPVPEHLEGQQPARWKCGADDGLQIGGCEL